MKSAKGELIPILEICELNSSGENIRGADEVQAEISQPWADSRKFNFSSSLEPIQYSPGPPELIDVFAEKDMPEMIEQARKVSLVVVGAVSFVVGLVLVPVPLIPGWPLLLFSGYCFNEAFKQ